MKKFKGNKYTYKGGNSVKKMHLKSQFFPLRRVPFSEGVHFIGKATGSQIKSQELSLFEKLPSVSIPLKEGEA